MRARRPMAVSYTHLGQVKQFLAGDDVLFFHVELLHLSDDAPAAAECEGAKFHELKK